MPSNREFFYASLLFRIVIAMPWLGPLPTPMGLMAIAGVSPRPTEAPGLKGIPQELLRRENVQYPPPENWCGFVNGIYDDPLSCNIGLTCVNSGEAVGCCTATTGICSALYTTCLNFGDDCNQACQLNPAIRKCSNALEPFCGTYAFPSDTTLFNCMETFTPIQNVEFLNDFYITAIGSTLASNPTTDPFGFTASAYLNSYAASPTSRGTGSSSSSSSTNHNPPHDGLSQGAIGAIAAGAAVVVALICGIIIFCCIRARRRKRIAAASRPPSDFPPPMQQESQPSPPPKAFDGYQSVPQQEQQHVEYPGPYQQAQPYFSPPASTVSPQSTSATDPRFSTANAILLSSRPSESEQNQYHYKAPVSPTVTEVDGTMGNPGIPTEVAHGVPTEVDGTMGNPGVPASGHGIDLQLMPGGSPSAAEIEGRMRQAPSRRPVGQGTMGASMNQPYSDGPYELGHDRP